MFALIGFAASQPFFFSHLRNKTIEIEDQSSVKLLDDESSWFYVYIPNDFNSTIRGIDYDSIKIINKNWINIYLKGHQVSKLKEKGLYFRPVNQDEKYIEINISDELTEILSIETSTEFDPPVSDDLIFIKMSPNSYDVKFVNITEAIKKLCMMPNVITVRKSIYPKINNFMGVGYTQFNTLEANKVRYLNDKGLNGNGVIAGVTDTFLDTNSTFFYSTNYPMKLVHGKELKDHRKISIIVDSPAYLGEITKYTISEHGTHVSGTMVGSALDSSVSIYNGVAPAAKLAFIQSGLEINIEESAYKKIFDLGVKVTSNSWGTFLADSRSMVLKTTVYNNIFEKYPNRLFVFAAGNEGTGANPSMNHYQTIGSPGTCKNALTVGSLDVVHVYPDRPEEKVYFMMEGMTYFEFKLIPWTKESDAYKELFTKDAVITIITDKSPFDLKFLKNRDNIIFYIKSEADLKNLGRLPPKYLITKFPIDTFDFSDFKKNVFIGSVDRDTAYVIENTISQIELTPIASIIPNYKSSDSPKRAKFSSKGPFINGLLKPDVVGPGEGIFSAASLPGAGLNHVNISLMSGTSMACPNVAGAGVLVHQYMKDKGINVSSSLIRAVLINAADPLDEATKYPNVETGFGQVNLGRYIPTDDKPNAKLIWKDNAVIKSDSHLVAEIAVKSNTEPLRITMSYLDSAGSSESMAALIFDFDLIVESPSNVIYRGNHRTDETEERFSTNERVIINPDEIETGTYKIHVFSNKYGLLSFNHKFSIVAFGDISSTSIAFKDATTCVTCPSCEESKLSCEKNMKWKCLKDFSTGHSCQSPVLEYFHENKSISFPIEALGIIYVVIYFPTHETGDFDDLTHYISPNNAHGASYSISSSEIPKSQFDADEHYFGSFYSKSFDNRNHEYPADQLTPYLRVMIKSNAPFKSEIKISSIINQGIVFTPKPWTLKEDYRSIGFIIGIVAACVIIIAFVINICCNKCSSDKNSIDENDVERQVGNW